MRNRNSIQFMTLVILFSILTVFLEFLLLYVLKKDISAVGVGSLIVLITSIVLLKFSHNHEALFIYMLLNVVLSCILAAYSFWEIRYFYFSISNYELWIVAANFLIPCIISLFFDLFDSSDIYRNYKTYYRNSSLLFFIVYIAAFIYIQFTPNASYIWGTNQMNYIPFYTMAGYIEDYIYKVGTLNNIFLHMLVPVLLFLPIGFLIALFFRQGHRVLRLLLLLVVPLLTELLQYVLSINTVNIDDVIYAFFGGLIGQLCFFLLNALYLGIKQRSFLEESHSYSSTLHF